MILWVNLNSKKRCLIMHRMFAFSCSMLFKIKQKLFLEQKQETRWATDFKISTLHFSCKGGISVVIFCRFFSFKLILFSSTVTSRFNIGLISVYKLLQQPKKPWAMSQSILKTSKSEYPSMPNSSISSTRTWTVSSSYWACVS